MARRWIWRKWDSTCHRLVFPRTLVGSPQMPIEKTAKSTSLTVRRSYKECLCAVDGSTRFLAWRFARASRPPRPPRMSETTQTPPSVDAAPDSPLASTDCDSSRRSRLFDFGRARSISYGIYRIRKYPYWLERSPEPYAELVQRLPDSTITPLFGGGAGRIDYGEQSGVRLEVGCWLDDDQHSRPGGRIFSTPTGPATKRLSVGGRRRRSASPIGIRRPRSKSLLWTPCRGCATAPWPSTPTIIYGAWKPTPSSGCPRRPSPELLHLLAGFRHLQFDEGLSINSTSTLVPNGHLPCG